MDVLLTSVQLAVLKNPQSFPAKLLSSWWATAWTSLCCCMELLHPRCRTTILDGSIDVVKKQQLMAGQMEWMAVAGT